MPSCGCPDVPLDNGLVRPCACQPCSEGDLQGCSCNKETGCACSSTSEADEAASRCVCTSMGKACSCNGCACKDAVRPTSNCCATSSCCS